MPEKIKMISPDGRPLSVPINEVARLEELGARVTQESSKSYSKPSGNIVKMISPDGRSLSVPIHDIQSLKDLGARELQPETSIGKSSAVLSKGAAAGSLGSIPDTLSMLYNLPAKAVNYARTIDPELLQGSDLAPMSPHQAELPMIPSATEGIEKGIDELTGGYTKTPKSMKSAYEGVKFASGLAGPGGLGKLLEKGGRYALSKVPNAIGSVKPSMIAGSGLAGVTTSELENSPLASTLGGVGVGVTAPWLLRNVGKLRNPLNAAAEGIGRATGFNTKKYAQNAELGLPVSVGTVSNYTFPNQVEMLAAKYPGSIHHMEDFYKKREAAIAKNLGIATPDDLEYAVKNIPKHLAKEGAKGYHKRASKIYQKREEKFAPREEEAIKNQELVDVSDIINKLEEKKSLRLTKASKKRFDKTKEGMLLKDLKESIPGQSESDVVDALIKQGYPQDLINKILASDKSKTKQGIGLEELNELRQKALDESISLKTPFGGGTPESRDAVIRSEMLSNKRHQFMEETGSPSEIRNARQARKFWAQHKNEENGMAKYVAKLTGSEDDATAFKKLTSTNPKYLNIARQGLEKKDRPKLWSSVIADLGERQGRFNINTAYTGFSDLAKPVREELSKTAPTKTAKQSFEKVMKFVGENKKMMEKFANTSNTTHTKEVMKLITAYGAAAASALTGISAVPLLGLVATQASINLGSRIWTNQNFLNRMNKTITASNEKGKINNIDLLLKSINQVARQKDSHNNS